MNNVSIEAAAGASRAVSSAFDGLGRWLSYRDTVTELLTLTPSQLAEIGVRGDVEAHAWRLANR